MSSLAGEPSGSATSRLAESYLELRAIAARLFQRESALQTLEPTALVHEALLRLRNFDASGDRRRLVASCARVMRHLLVDRARRRSLQRAFERRLHERREPEPAQPADRVLALDAALEELDAQNPELARVVEVRWILGRSTAEAAHDLDTSERSVKRRWALARAWLQRRIEELESDESNAME